MNAAFLIGRMMFGGFFIYNGINHFRNSEGMKGYIASKKVPMPDVANAAAGTLLLLGGTSIALGIQPKWGVAAIAAFLASVSPVMHAFWNEEGGAQQAEMINFSKNMAMLGAAIALAGVEEPWPASVPVARS